MALLNAEFDDLDLDPISHFTENETEMIKIAPEPVKAVETAIRACANQEPVSTLRETYNMLNDC